MLFSGVVKVIGESIQTLFPQSKMPIDPNIGRPNSFVTQGKYMTSPFNSTDDESRRFEHFQMF